MKISISLNEVLRDFLGQLTYTYGKYIGPCEVKEGDVTTFDLLEYYKFKDKLAMNKFIYAEAALEIFGHADQMVDKIFVHLNHFVMDMKDEGEHEIEIVSKEVESSIPATLFFLSKMACKVRNIRFVQDDCEKWDGVDVLITANPKALECKPDGKIAVKIKSSYNQNTIADFELDSIKEFLEDSNLRESILNKKIIIYQEKPNL